MSAETAERNQQVSLPLAALGSAIGLGAIGDLLLYPTPWGVGVPIFTLLMVVAVAFLARRSEIPLAPDLKWIVAAILPFSFAFAWRDAEALRGLNGLAIVLLVGMIAIRRGTGKATRATLLDYPFRIFGVWFQFIADAGSLLNLEGRWPALKNRKGSKGFTAVARGVFIAIPLLFVFGALFASADATFERLMSNAFRFDFEDFVPRVWTFAAIVTLAGGFLRRLLFAVDPPPVQGPPSPHSRIGITETGIVLGSLNLLFAAFVATQFEKLFGGSELVRSTAGMGVAEYARRGFFELATVAFLSLTVLVGSHAALRREGKSETIYRGLAGVMVVLVFIVMQSAVMRMRLYVDAFGTTQLRIYVLAAIGWIAAVFLWFAVTSLRGRYDRFAFGALSLFLLGIFGLNVANPDAMVARINTSRPSNLDASYLNGLSADAVPELIQALPKLPAADRATLQRALDARRADLSDEDFRAWNLGRQGALGALRTLPRGPSAIPSQQPTELSYSEERL